MIIAAGHAYRYASAVWPRQQVVAHPALPLVSKPPRNFSTHAPTYLKAEVGKAAEDIEEVESAWKVVGEVGFWLIERMLRDSSLLYRVEGGECWDEGRGEWLLVLRLVDGKWMENGRNGFGTAQDRSPPHHP